MSATSNSDRRTAARVRYPSKKSSPCITVIAEDFQVSELTEHEVRFYCATSDAFPIGEHVAAVLRCRDACSYPVDGVVASYAFDQVVVTLDAPLPSTVLDTACGDQRAFFRLRYPIADRPQSSLLGQQYQTTEISEYGMRLATPSTEAFAPDQVIEVVITFQDGEMVTVLGRVLRIEEAEVALGLLDSIPEARITREQRYLLQKYSRV